jgi:hypothetical protein
MNFREFVAAHLAFGAVTAALAPVRSEKQHDKTAQHRAGE